MKVFQAIFVSFIFLLSGCSGIKNWMNQTFDQGLEYKQQRKIIDQYVKSVTIYDQFTTVALFDALWLSDQIRILYSHNYAAMHGRSKEVEKTFLRRQLKANADHISFYVLSTHEVQLNLKPSEWVMYLQIGDKKYPPLEVKSVEIAPEYESFFGPKLTNHKRPYEVRFDRKDSEGKDLLIEGQKISLYFSSPVHYAAVTWTVKHDSDLFTEATSN